ncbi:hypothetical protein T02_10095 [Trichinella nativa]|uniref:Uncharacterized protein n=1 Tax=Trichinella nativa TaxID=6335 RepID=A0A0V1KK31_9BILA|nr:hypothetical protein T02_10095 [Trichinella nativa]
MKVTKEYTNERQANIAFICCSINGMMRNKDVKIHIEVEYPTYVSRCLTLRAQCLSFMQIGPFENELHISSAPVTLTLLTNRSIDSDVCSIYFCFNY